MSDLPPARDHDASGGWLTPTAAAIAGLALAVLALSARGAWMLTVEAFLTRNGSASFADTVMLNAFVQAVVAAGALLLSRRGIGAASPTARHLGGAGVLLAVVGLAVALLTFVAGMLSSV